MDARQPLDETQLRDSLRTPMALIAVVSIAAMAFLLWLVYGRIPPAEYATRLTFLPAVNATFNALSAISLVVGYRFVRRRQLVQHERAMITAFVFSSLFLCTYILNHALHGESHYPPHGFFRSGYLAVLVSHILLSIAALPLVLFTFFLSLSGRFAIHRRVARYTFPIWLYVSVTGVVVYFWFNAAK